MSWTPSSWRSLPIQQQPDYRDANAVQRALDTVHALPPLVSVGEVKHLRNLVAQAQEGRAFWLQGGDCAERFVDCAASPIEDKLRILLQMSLILTWGARLPVIRVGRMAGQYAKPRSKPTEVVDGVTMASYRGDYVNGIEASPEAREPDPERMVQAYFRSAATLNYARALVDGGFAHLYRLHDWDLGFVRDPDKRAQYADIRARIEDALAFMETTGVHGEDTLGRVDLFTSHEGLALAYEEAQTLAEGEDWYNLGAHFLWIGDRTRQLDGAHVEYFRGIENPIGIKVGPTMQPQELVELLQVLEPQNRPGRITLITRFGADKVQKQLKPLVQAMTQTNRRVLWCCDPMHGNTTTTDEGYKTRNFDAILRELTSTFDTLEECGTHLGGVHFELTGEDVTECTGGPQELSEADLSRNYVTYCDPRLNYAQSVEMALIVAQRLATRRGAEQTDG